LRIRIFTTTVCPKCNKLKQLLAENGIAFDVLDMQSPEGMSELFEAEVFTFTAPVLQVKSKFYKSEELNRMSDSEILKTVGVE
jgi:glutaredoxin